jgi:hypothetical protein
MKIRMAASESSKTNALEAVVRRRPGCLSRPSGREKEHEMPLSAKKQEVNALGSISQHKS